MNMFRIVLHLFHFLSWFVQESHSHKGFCQSRNPVVKICTDHALAKKSTVFLDTVSVPTFQHTSCKCILSPFKYEVGYTFTVYGQNYTNGMKFEINDIVINETVSRKNTYLIGETPIYFSTAEDYTTEGTCVIVDTDDSSFFNITCMKSTTSTTEQSQSTQTRKATEFSTSTTTRNATESSTSTLTRKPTVTSISTGKVTTLNISSSSKGVTEANSNTEPDEETRQANHIIPLVTAISGIVCLAIVIAVIIFYKRRKTRKRPMVNSSKSTAEQEQENNYYMTENPMYNVNVTETQPDTEHTENVYHYIEHNQLDSRRQTVQYESLPDSPVGKHLPTNVSKHNQNYDYTTCQEMEYVAGNTNKLDTGNETGKMSSEKVDAGETMYDRTDKAAVKQFSGMNEYHQLRPAGSSEMFVLDTYDTIGKVGEKEEEQKEPEYDVTHSR